MYTDKYLKYKNKYIQLKSKLGGSTSVNSSHQMFPVPIRIATVDDECPLFIEGDLSYCNICFDSESINDFIILVINFIFLLELKNFNRRKSK
jgi:hypothetical protein